MPFRFLAETALFLYHFVRKEMQPWTATTTIGSLWKCGLLTKHPKKMFRRYNPNPDGLHVGDCTVRAICAVTGLDWYTVHDQQCALSRDMADMPSADRVWWELLRQYGFARQHMIDRCPDCYTVAQFARDHPRGVYVLGPKEHAVAVINGDWWDSWDSGFTVPTYYFGRK